MAAIAQVSNEDIRALGLTPAELLAAMARAVESLQRGDAGFIHKKAMHPRAGGEFYAMPATLGELAVVKWLNVAAKPAPGAPLIQAQLLATHIPSGRVLALMDAEWITAVRTAAISALAACWLRVPGAASLAIIGCGLQARTHLAAWQDAFASRQVLAHSRRRSSAAARHSGGRAGARAGGQGERRGRGRRAARRLCAAQTRCLGFHDGGRQGTRRNEEGRAGGRADLADARQA